MLVRTRSSELAKDVELLVLRHQLVVLRRRFCVPRVPRSTRAALLESSGLAAIVAGVALVNVPAAVILGGALAVAAAFTLEHPGNQP